MRMHILGIDEFFPSEIARLVLGYLHEELCEKSYGTFLEESIFLHEYRVLVERGCHVSMTVNGKSLKTILKEYFQFIKSQEVSFTGIEKFITLNSSKRDSLIPVCSVNQKSLPLYTDSTTQTFCSLSPVPFFPKNTSAAIKSSPSLCVSLKNSTPLPNSNVCKPNSYSKTVFTYSAQTQLTKNLKPLSKSIKSNHSIGVTQSLSSPKCSEPIEYIYTTPSISALCTPTKKSKINLKSIGKSPRRKGNAPRRKSYGTAREFITSSQSSILPITTPLLEKVIIDAGIPQKLADTINKVTLEGAKSSLCCKTSKENDDNSKETSSTCSHQIEIKNSNPDDKELQNLLNHKISEGSFEDAIGKTIADTDFDALFNLFNVDKYDFLKKEYGYSADKKPELNSTTVSFTNDNFNNQDKIVQTKDNSSTISQASMPTMSDFLFPTSNASITSIPPCSTVIREITSSNSDTIFQQCATHSSQLTTIAFSQMSNNRCTAPISSSSTKMVSILNTRKPKNGNKSSAQSKSTDRMTKVRSVAMQNCRVLRTRSCSKDTISKETNHVMPNNMKSFHALTSSNSSPPSRSNTTHLTLDLNQPLPKTNHVYPTTIPSSESSPFTMQLSSSNSLLLTQSLNTSSLPIIYVSTTPSKVHTTVSSNNVQSDVVDYSSSQHPENKNTFQILHLQDDSTGRTQSYLETVYVNDSTIVTAEIHDPPAQLPPSPNNNVSSPPLASSFATTNTSTSLSNFHVPFANQSASSKPVMSVKQGKATKRKRSHSKGSNDFLTFDQSTLDEKPKAVLSKSLSQQKQNKPVEKKSPIKKTPKKQKQTQNRQKKSSKKSKKLTTKLEFGFKHENNVNNNATIGSVTPKSNKATFVNSPSSTEKLRIVGSIMPVNQLVSVVTSSPSTISMPNINHSISKSVLNRNHCRVLDFSRSPITPTSSEEDPALESKTVSSFVSKDSSSLVSTLQTNAVSSLTSPASVTNLLSNKQSPSSVHNLNNENNQFLVISSTSNSADLVQHLMTPAHSGEFSPASLHQTQPSFPDSPDLACQPSSRSASYGSSQPPTRPPVSRRIPSKSMTIITDESLSQDSTNKNFSSLQKKNNTKLTGKNSLSSSDCLKNSFSSLPAKKSSSKSKPLSTMNVDMFLLGIHK